MATDLSSIALYRSRDRRERVEIHGHILYLLQDEGSMSKTKLMNKTELNHEAITDHLKELQDEGLITFYGDMYHIVDKGRKFLEAYVNLVRTKFPREDRQ